jgi:hypothetical protein
LTRLKTIVVEPMPSARTTTATRVNPQLFRSDRTA